MTGAAEQARYLAVRQRLGALGYKSQAFSADSVDLVEALLSDLTNTTEAYESLQLKDQRLAQDLSLAQAQLFPLRKENARLARENYQTRVELIAKTESESAQLLEHRVAISNMEDRVSDLTALCVAKDTRLREVEREAARLQKHIERSASEAEQDGRSKQPVRNIVVSSPVPRAASAPESLFSDSSAASADTALITSLRNQIQTLTGLLRESEDKASALSSAVRAREGELARLSSTLAEGTGDATQSRAAQLELANTQHKRLIAQLNDQVDFLNEQLAQRELQVSRMAERQVQLEGQLSSVAFREEQLLQMRGESDRLTVSLRACEARLGEAREAVATERAAGETRLAAQMSEAEERLVLMQRQLERALVAQSSQRVAPEGPSAAGRPLERETAGEALAEAVDSAWPQQVLALRLELEARETALESLHEELRQRQRELASSRVSEEELRSRLLRAEASVGESSAAMERRLQRAEAQVRYLEEPRAEESVPVPVEAPSVRRHVVLQLESDEALVREVAVLRAERDHLASLLRDAEDKPAPVELIAEDTERLQRELEAAAHRIRAMETERVSGNDLFSSLQREIHDKDDVGNKLRSALMRAEQALAEREQQLQSFSVSLNARLVDLVEQNQELQRRLEHAEALAVTVPEIETQSRSEAPQHVSEELLRSRALVAEYAAMHEEDQERLRELESELRLSALRLEESVRESERRGVALVESREALQQSVSRVSVLEREVYESRVTSQRGGAEEQRLESMIDGLRRQLNAATTDGEAARRQLAMVSEARDGLERTAEDLKALVTTLDVDVKAVGVRNNKLHGTIRSLEEELRRCREELVVARSIIVDRENQLSSLEETLVAREQAEGEERAAREALAAEVESGVRVRQQLQQQILQMKEAVEHADKRLASSAHELAKAQRAVRDAETKESSARQEVSVLRQAVAQRVEEVTAAAEDLMLMTRENQALTTELAQAAHEQQQLRGKIGELTQALSSQEQQRLSLETERADLLATYRAVIQDKRRLEVDMQKLSVSRQEGLLREQRVGDDVSMLKGQVDAYRAAERRWLGDRAALSQQLEGLNDSTVRLQRRLEGAEADNRRLGEDVHSLREANRLLNERVAMVMKRAAAATDNAKMLSARLALAENERDALRSTIGSERQRALELEQVAMAARSQAALAYSRERLFTESSFPVVSQTRQSATVYEDVSESILDSGLEAVYEVSEAEERDSPSSDDSLPTTVTDRPLVPGSASSLVGALGTDFESEADSLDANYNLSYGDTLVQKKVQSQYREISKQTGHSPMR